MVQDEHRPHKSVAMRVCCGLNLHSLCVTCRTFTHLLHSSVARDAVHSAQTHSSCASEAGPRDYSLATSLRATIRVLLEIITQHMMLARSVFPIPCVTLAGATCQLQIIKDSSDSEVAMPSPPNPLTTLSSLPTVKVKSLQLLDLRYQ